MQLINALIQQLYTLYTAFFDQLITMLFEALNLAIYWIWTAVGEITSWAFDTFLLFLYNVGIAGVPIGAPQGDTVRRAFYFADQFAPFSELLALTILVWAIIAQIRAARWVLSFIPLLNTG